MQPSIDGSNEKFKYYYLNFQGDKLLNSKYTQIWLGVLFDKYKNNDI